jgi:hypothetical protein
VSKSKQNGRRHKIRRATWSAGTGQSRDIEVGPMHASKKIYVRRSKTCEWSDRSEMPYHPMEQNTKSMPVASLVLVTPCEQQHIAAAAPASSHLPCPWAHDRTSVGPTGRDETYRCDPARLALVASSPADGPSGRSLLGQVRDCRIGAAK